MNNLTDKQRKVILLVGGLLGFAGTAITILFTPSQEKELKKLDDRIKLLEKGE